MYSKQTDKMWSLKCLVLLKCETRTSIKQYNRQGTYCNNLATKVTPFFIVSKSSVGETISKTVLPHFSKDPLPRC